MSDRDADIDEIMRHAISQALDLWSKPELETAVSNIHEALERAGYAIRRSEQEPYGLMPVYRMKEV